MKDNKDYYAAFYYAAFVLDVTKLAWLYSLGGGVEEGYSRFQVIGMIRWGKNQNLKNSLDQKINPQKNPVLNFWALKFTRKC